MASIGIDFGTTNSVAATYHGDSASILKLDEPPLEWQPYGFESVLPTVFSIDNTGVMSFGWKAKVGTANKFEAVKRLFATQEDFVYDSEGDSLLVEEAATLVFAEIRRRAFESGIDASQAVITVPANSLGRARHRTKICAGMAGFEVLGLINEPTAAAMAYAQRHPEARNFLVFDWGGGTLDVTVLQATQGVFIERASSGLQTLGGLDFDSRLSRHIARALDPEYEWSSDQRNRFRLEIELAKIRLSTAESTTVVLPDGKAFHLARSEFESVVTPLIEEARGPIMRCLNDLHIGPGGVDALVMVGGTCKIPAVRAFVQSIIPAPMDWDIDPMTVVAEGSAIAAAIMTGENQKNDFFVSTEHALGTIVHDAGVPSFSVLIPRNHKLPAKATSTYYPVSEETDSVLVRVVEGDPVGFTDDFVLLKEWDVPLHPEATGSRGFELTYEYDVSGILQVTAVDESTGEELFRGDVAYGISEDKLKLRQIADNARSSVAEGRLLRNDNVNVATATTDGLDAEAKSLLNRARTQVIPFVSDEDARHLENLCQTLEHEQIDIGQSKQALRAALAPFSYLF